MNQSDRMDEDSIGDVPDRPAPTKSRSRLNVLPQRRDAKRTTEKRKAKETDADEQMDSGHEQDSASVAIPTKETRNPFKNHRPSKKQRPLSPESEEKRILEAQAKASRDKPQPLNLPPRQLPPRRHLATFSKGTESLESTELTSQETQVIETSKDFDEYMAEKDEARRVAKVFTRNRKPVGVKRKDSHGRRGAFDFQERAGIYGFLWATQEPE